MRALMLEPLERRDLFSIAPNSEPLIADDPLSQLGNLSHGGGCTCPVCAGTVANSPELWAPFQVTNSPKHSLSELPQLSSLPSAQYTLVLDFNGAVTSGWASQPVTTPVYDFDGDRTTFSTAELNAVFEIWSRVTEDYAPFNINVTTVDPGHLTNGQVAKVAIGGDYSDWFGSPAGGVAYVGGFYNSASNVGFVFSDALGGGYPRYVAEATSHEAGHLFGLWHQSTYDTSGQKTAEYSSGNSQWAPIMGVGYYAAVTAWHVGPNNLGPNVIQDDMATLASRLGWRSDESGSSTSTAAQLQISGNSVSGTGVISYHTDQDYYRFSTGGGTVTLSANPAIKGANLDIALELRRSDGTLITTASPLNSMAASLTTNLAAGDYFLVTRGAGQYGYVGNYILSGTVPAATNNNSTNDSQPQTNDNSTDNNTDPQTTGPNIAIYVGDQQIDYRSVVSFGTVRQGTRVQQTFTVRNAGDSSLLLAQLTNRNIPRGFSLVQGLSDTVLGAGESATFTLQMNYRRGNYGGWVGINSNDADQPVFQFAVTGVVNRTGIARSRASLADRDNTTLATGVTLAGLGIEDTTVARHLGGSMSDRAVDRAFSEFGQQPAATPLPGNLRFDMPNTDWHASKGEITDDELLDHSDEQFGGALDEVIDGALSALV